MDANPGFFNRVAPYYGEAWTIEEQARVAVRRLVEEFCSRVPTRSGESGLPRILEVGCGNGRVLCNLPPGTFGVDFAPDMLPVARRRVPSAHLVAADAVRLPFRPGVFQAAVLVNVVHNHPDPAPLLGALAHAGIETLFVDTRHALNPVVLSRAVRYRGERFIRYRPEFPWRWRRTLLASGWRVRRAVACPRPWADPREGFRWRHLFGWLLSIIPGLAPVYVWECERIGKAT